MDKQVILFAFLVVSMPCAAQGTDVEELLAKSNPVIQDQFEGVLKSVKSLDSEFDLWSNTEVATKVKVLRESVPDQTELVKQLAIYAATPGEEPPDYARVILEFLHLEPEVVIRGLAPYLGIENENIRSFVRSWFQYHDICAEGPSALQAVNYADYLDYVRGNLKRNEETPPAFIEYIYERSPERALIIFTYANPQRHAEIITRFQEMRKSFDSRQQHGNNGPSRPLPPTNEVKPQDLIGKQLPKVNFKEIRLAEHIVSDAIWLKANGFQERHNEAMKEAEEHLARLSEHSEWWVRLYVVEIMRQHREFRQAELLEKLSRDSNSLVRKIAEPLLD